MQAMPKRLPPHLQRETTRHGKPCWYVRKGKGARIRLRADYGSEAFWEQYRAALETDSPQRAGKAANGTLAWLVALYRQSAPWLNLSMATRRQRENILKHVLASAGRDRIAMLTKRAIERGRDRRAKTPAQARHFVDTMRGLFRWAVEAELAKADPTAGVKAAKPKTRGFLVWTEDELEQYEARWPLGTRERVMFDVFVYTGLRRGDAARLGKQHFKNGIITIDTEKTGTRVTIPVLPELQRTLDAGPVGDLAVIASRKGAPLTKETLGNFFRDACRAASINKSAHGIRKAAATRCANSGATVAQLEAIFGWEGGRMASLYTRSADRSALALQAMPKLSRKT